MNITKLIFAGTIVLASSQFASADDVHVTTSSDRNVVVRHDNDAPRHEVRVVHDREWYRRHHHHDDAHGPSVNIEVGK